MRTGSRKLTLIKLPSELIVKILQNFCVHCAKVDEHAPWKVETWCDAHSQETLRKERRNLYNLCLIFNKKISWEAQSILHHVFGCLDNFDKSLLRFCRTISANPELGKKVQILCLDPRVELTWRGTEDIQWTQHPISQFKSRLDDFMLPEDPAEHGPYLLSFIPALTLLQVPKLKQLNMGSRGRWYVLSHLKRHSKYLRLLVPELKFLDMNTPSIRTVPGLWSPLSQAFLRALIMDRAGLESLALSLVPNSSISPGLNIPNLRRLSLVATTLSKNQLQNFVGATGKLEEFKYSELQEGRQPQTMSQADDNATPATAHEILSILETKKDTLRKISLHTYHRSQEDLEPLSRLHKLKSLQLNIRTFCDIVVLSSNGTINDVDTTGLFEFLPPSLRSLEIATGPRGLERLYLCVSRFCGSDSKKHPMRPSALALRRILLDLTKVEKEYEAAGRLDPASQSFRSECYNMVKSIKQLCRKWVEGGKRMFEICTEGGLAYNTRTIDFIKTSPIV